MKHFLSQMVGLMKMKAVKSKQTRQIKTKNVKPPEELKNKKEIYFWIKKVIPQFPEWYQPVDFGDGLIAYRTIPPKWQPVQGSLEDNEGGLAKWNFIVKKHLPSLKGKRVLDLGCSTGLFSLELAKLGAREVIGIDRSAKFNYRSTKKPPLQDVISQAKFVKSAFELLNKTKYPVYYFSHDIADIDKLRLGKFDLILALCVVYHELDHTPELIKKLSKMTDHLILQGNEVHTGELGKWSNKITLAKLLFDAGFISVEIDAPPNYPLPVLVAKK